jgi:hypothetical protein
MKCDFCYEQSRSCIMWCSEVPKEYRLEEQFMCGKCFINWMAAKSEVLQAIQRDLVK